MNKQLWAGASSPALGSDTSELQPAEVSPAEIVAELEADYRRELRKLDDFAFVFLDAAGGDPVEAERLLDDFVALIFEGSVISNWRHRILLAAIRGGL